MQSCCVAPPPPGICASTKAPDYTQTIREIGAEIDRLMGVFRAATIELETRSPYQIQSSDIVLRDGTVGRGAVYKGSARCMRRPAKAWDSTEAQLLAALGASCSTILPFIGFIDKESDTTGPSSSSHTLVFCEPPLGCLR